MLRRFVIVLALAWLAAAACVCHAADNAGEDTAGPKTSSEPKVTISADGMKAADVIASLATQSGEKILAESSVKEDSLTFSVSDAPIRTALAAMCAAGDLQWREVYIKKDSSMLNQPDRLAATTRLVTGVGLPDVVVASSSSGSVAAHYVDPKSVGKLVDTTASEAGMVRVYLITDDAAAAARSRDAAKTDAVEAYTETSKKLMDDFLKMTPEEQEQAIVAGITLYEQMDPSYMSSVMQAMMKTDRELVRRVMARQTEMLFHMPEQQRRSMMRMNMEMMQYLTPEQMQILAEDAKAIMEQMNQ